MKVNGPSGMNAASGPKAGKATGGQGGFSLPVVGGASAAAETARAGNVGNVTSLDALIALQDIGGPLERRRRAVGRAGRILDVLDDIKMTLLDGAMDPASLDTLMRAVREERASTDDPALEGVLNEIETRAAVELAKLQVRHAA